MTDTTAFTQASARLRSFRARFNAGDVVDEESGFTADDLDVILAAIDHAQARVKAEDEVIDKVGDLA